MTTPDTFTVQMKDSAGSVVRQVQNVTGWDVVGESWIRTVVYNASSQKHLVMATRVPAEVVEIVQG